MVQSSLFYSYLRSSACFARKHIRAYVALMQMNLHKRTRTSRPSELQLVRNSFVGGIFCRTPRHSTYRKCKRCSACGMQRAGR
jgi:hypothetical protein